MPIMLYETFKLLPLNLCLLHPLKLCLKNSDIPISDLLNKRLPLLLRIPYTRVILYKTAYARGYNLCNKRTPYTRLSPQKSACIRVSTFRNLRIPLFCRTVKLQQEYEASTTPSFCLRYSKVSLGSGFVRISATCSLEGTYSNLTFCSSTCSLRK